MNVFFQRHLVILFKELDREILILPYFVYRNSQISFRFLPLVEECLHMRERNSNCVPHDLFISSYTE